MSRNKDSMFVPPSQISEMGLKNLLSSLDPTTGKFGWQEIHSTLVPFIKRNGKDYMLTSMAEKQIFRAWGKYFTNEIAFCVKAGKVSLTQQEADLFNEINERHCDRTLSPVPYNTSHTMAEAEDIRRMADFLNVCYKTLIDKVPTNDLFGFLKVAGFNDVPFVWSGPKKLAPTFYFDGHAEYLEKKAVPLMDKWMMAYLRFCCKVHNIKRDYYEVETIKVVDLEDVYPLFPNGTTFKICLPHKINETLLLPNAKELRNKIRLPPKKPLKKSVKLNLLRPIKMKIPSTGATIDLTDSETPSKSIDSASSNAQFASGNGVKTIGTYTPIIPARSNLTPLAPLPTTMVLTTSPNLQQSVPNNLEVLLTSERPSQSIVTTANVTDNGTATNILGALLRGDQPQWTQPANVGVSSCTTMQDASMLQGLFIGT